MPLGGALDLHWQHWIIATHDGLGPNRMARVIVTLRVLRPQPTDVRGCQIVPRNIKRLIKGRLVCGELFHDSLVRWIAHQGDVAGQPQLSYSVRAIYPPLLVTTWAIIHLPLILHRVTKELIVPLKRITRPGAFEPGSDSIGSLAG